jgi:hypothetical protein
MTRRIQRELSGRQQVAIRRWKLGHHAFHLYLLAMNTELPLARGYTAARKWDELAISLTRLIRLYDAATASMKYAADFDPGEYAELIRPSMSPPFLSPGFSGKANEDHATMLRLMAEMQSALKNALRDGRAADIPAEVHTCATALWAAQARNRRHHMLVCEKFVPGGRSLLKEYFATLESKTSPEGEIIGGHRR